MGLDRSGAFPECQCRVTRAAGQPVASRGSACFEPLREPVNAVAALFMSSRETLGVHTAAATVVQNDRLGGHEFSAGVSYRGGNLDGDGCYAVAIAVQQIAGRDR